MSGFRFIFFYSFLCFFACYDYVVPQIHAGVIELSGSGSYSSSRFGNTGQQWSRRWSLSAGYYLVEWSELEFVFQDVLYRTQLTGIEDTTFHDQIFSLDWVQYLAPKHYPVVPYLKAGIGQLNRDASGTYGPNGSGGGPPQAYGSLTAILGAGIKIKITQSFALKAEASTYLTGGVLSSWQDNVAGSAGFSFYF